MKLKFLLPLICAFAWYDLLAESNSIKSKFTLKRTERLDSIKSKSRASGENNYYHVTPHSDLPSC